VQRLGESLWEGRGRCAHGHLSRLALCHRALGHRHAHLFGMASASGSVRHLVARRGLVADFVIGCGALHLCCSARGRGRARLEIRAGCHGRGADRAVFRCLTLCGLCAM